MSDAQEKHCGRRMWKCIPGACLCVCLQCSARAAEARRERERAETPAYRVGRKVGNTLYDGDTFIGSCTTPEHASKIVFAAMLPYALTDAEVNVVMMWLGEFEDHVTVGDVDESHVRDLLASLHALRKP